MNASKLYGPQHFCESCTRYLNFDQLAAHMLQVRKRPLQVRKRPNEHMLTAAYQ
jgi:hypothetical protein